MRLPVTWRQRINSSYLCLYINTHTAATGYSKVSRGLHFPLDLPGFCTRREFSEGSSRGQWKSRCAIHAGRHSNGKAFRYLKRVIVTPAVYQPLARLDPSFRYWHWADVTSYTHLCRLAAGCVFVKQSDLPSHCTLHMPLRTCTGTPYAEGTGLFCRVPSRSLIPSRFRLLTLGHLCRFWVRLQESMLSPFSGTPGISVIHLAVYHSHGCSASQHYVT